MKLLILYLISVFSLSYDMGNVGRYEVEICTKNGSEINANFRIASYDELKSNFKSDEAFKNFLFNIYGAEHLDSLRFFKEFYYINYPEYNNRNEKLTAILKQDWLTISKSDISEIKFKSLKIIDHVGLATQLNIDEIKLLQSKPESINRYSIDPEQETYADFWILSYNPEINEKDLNQLVNKFKEAYNNRTVKGKTNTNYWIIKEMVDNWRKKLKEKNVYLIKIINP